MPIEVTTSPSITDTLHSYRDFSCQPSFLAKISRTAPVTNWITQEQAIVMENPATDRRNHQINSVYSNQQVPQGLPSFQPPPFLPRSSPLDKNASPDHSMSSDSSISTGNASWDLAEGIARLNINNGYDATEGIRGSIRTPPKPKKATDNVVQLHDSSPLESSDTSLDSRPSPPVSDECHILANHSRVSSADTTASSQLSGSSHTLASSALGLKVGPEQRDRPHSYSGGLSTADLQRLRGVGASPPDGERPQWSAAVDRQGQYDQPLYPSLSGYPRQSIPVAEDLQVDYATQQRQFQPLDGPIPNAPAFNARVGGALNGAPNYRSQPGRGYNPGLVANGTYPPPNHTAHLSLGNTQQVYDIMMPSHENPAVARVQQQHNVFRATHQHSSSDPLHLREAAALLSSGLPFQPGLYPPTLGPPAMGIYPNQFYPPPDAYATGVTAQVMAAARLQSQYPPYNVGLPGQSISPVHDGSQGSASGDPSGNGPSANNRKLGLYKTELCRSWEEKGTCRYGPKCQFAHGEDEIRKVARHPKYKTEICRTFWVSGSCPYGKRCCFIHTELPANGAAPGADGVPPPKVNQTRGRSDSDPNDAPVSLLQRISAKRNQEVVATNVETNYQPPSRPRTGSLRVDTSSLDQPAIKQQQNKSAYPSFTAKGVLFSQANDSSGGLSPGPVTAGPDLGSRQLIHFGQTSKQRTSGSNIRHSFNGTEMTLDLTPATPFAAPQPETAVPRATGHSRSGSVGNWANLSRHLAAPSPLHGPQSASPGNEGKLNTPWLTAEQGTRYAEKAWA
jgi:tristetraprolin/butyrate response factor 1